MPLAMPDIFKTSAYGDVLFAVTILAITLIAARIFYPILRRVVHHLAKKTETTLDDELVNALEKPVYIAIFIVGLYYAIVAIDFVVPYIELVKKAFTILGIIVGGYTASKIVDVFFTWYQESIAIKTHTKMDDKLMPVFGKMFRYLILISVAIIIIHVLGFEITPLLAGLGIGGIAIALALQPTLSNFFAGTYIATEGAIKVGDFIELENKLSGYVEEIGSRSTKIRTLPNNLIVIPNAKLAESIVTNYSEPTKEVGIIVSAGVSYDSDLERVEKITLEVAKKIHETDSAVKSFEPFIRYTEFGDSNIDFNVMLRAKSFKDQAMLKHEFIKALKKRFDKERIEISFPTTKVYLKKK